MRAIWVKIRIKSAERERFLQAIEVDALGSERDEPGCLRFNVLQDAQDENVYYCYEVFTDAAAMDVHRATPHFAAWRAVADALDGPSEVTQCRTIFPADPEYWHKPTRADAR
jgi:(4S)-4-hydroxy-5-phosphonooxypentane-2,3-dione isomerase